MRDFNSGDIHGDVTINDNSQNSEYKLLIHCSNEELLQEEAHRKQLLRNERTRKNRVTWKFIAVAAAKKGTLPFKLSVDMLVFHHA